MQDISLRNLTESRGFEDEKTEDAAHQCSACGMHDDICTSGQCTCSGGGTPENGVTAQEDTAAETIPFEGTTITKGGNYEIPEGTYTGGITIDTEDDTTDEVTIRITGDVTFTQPNKIFIDVEHVKLVTIENDGHTVKLNGHHFMDFFHSGSAVVNGGTYIAPGRNMIMLRGSGNSLTLNNVNMQTNTGYAVTTENTGHTVVVNGGTFTKSSSANSEFMNYGHLTLTDVTVIPEADGDGKTSTIVENYPGAVLEINGGNYKTINQNCIVNNGMARINDGTFASEGASCINNKWGRVEINDGTITSNADCTIKNRGILHMNGGTVASTNPHAVVIDCDGDNGDTKINGGTIKGGEDGIRLKDLGSFVVTLNQATFENNTNDVHLCDGQKINIKKTFTGTATILTDDPSRGRQITLENEDLSYQNKLKLFSKNPGYIIGYKRGDDGVEYRYLADANGNIVNAVNAKATADLGAGEQELDTATVVPEGIQVNVTANLPEGAEFLGWSAVRADGIALKLGDDQTAHFEMPGCNVTVEALYQGGNGDIDNPSGGSSDVVAGIAAVALTGAAVWGIYETGTGIYRVLNMPGVPMPSNRAGLATLIWEKAGCPEPQTVKSFSDIDDADLHLRQAASWMEEQGLMDDVKENEFRPYRYVTKLQTCLVWDKAKEKSLIS
jgi:hypothetical protein